MPPWMVVTDRPNSRSLPKGLPALPSPATREGRVLQKLFERIKSIEEDLDPQRTGKVFNVLGDAFPANQLERMLREMYARNLTEEVIIAKYADVY